ncbi:MAG: hypothetical protein R2692_06365 [Microbacterium sp.]
MTDARVSAFQQEQVRPLHPGRPWRCSTGSGRASSASSRSAGFCRLATRPHITAQWEHTGQMFTLTPLSDDTRLADDDEFSVGQDLALSACTSPKTGSPRSTTPH